MILPFVRDLLAELEHCAPFERVQRHLAVSAGRKRVSGLTATARALYLPIFARSCKVPVVVIVADNKAADSLLLTLRATCELTGAIEPERVLRMPAHDVLPFENMSPHPDVQEQRASVLWKIATGAASIVIVPIEAACMRVFPIGYYTDLGRVLRREEEIDIEELTTHLASVGYSAMDIVEMPGQFTRRGGIFDVYSPEADRPVRIELFGDEIESIRKFEPDSQRSSTVLDETWLLPLTETPISDDLLAAVHQRLSGDDRPDPSGATVFPGWEFFCPVAGADRTFFDLFPKVQVFQEEPAMIRNQLERWWNKVEQRHERSGIGSLITPTAIYISPAEVETKISSLPGLEIDQLGAVDILDEDVNPMDEIAFSSRPTLRFHGSIPAFLQQIKTLAEQQTRMLLVAPNHGEVERLAGLLREYAQPYRLGSRAQATGAEQAYDESSHLAGDFRTPVLVQSAISSGVSLPDCNLVLFGANDFSDEADVTARPVVRKAKSKTAAFVSDFRDLTVADYVVHVEHGIARYMGLKEIEQEGVRVEFMVLEFAEAARLYVPLTRLDLIQKYRSTDAGPAPVLNRLGSQQWAKTKARVRKAMQDMADELLKLYAQRKAAQGHAFPPDNDFQREFEDAFDYNETEDQISAIADIKRDMESTLPMDRLLVGDVGYGKTEVAMRAAFKAVQDGRQVAVLTPTTVLSFQHFETFKGRFKQFPINVEMISRFRTAKEQKSILERVEAGKVDILIGTHRLLSKDLQFQNLGLLVVDEEQRFGVRHKERLKQMRREIDVLAMSATPIPRTLHMSLVGLRDMSVIETPPKDRMAIQTVVARFDEKLIRSALELELERGGQIYFVHNRVETIYEISAKIQELVPHARVTVGHGQMSEGELERVMLAFMHGEYDVLVATTIIENGLDIPLANTILISRADRHGLSELYQLRGRVGRSNRRAYAYLLIPPEQELTEVARRRLAALKEFSDLGAGFKIAALDLELRGAGNMLGGEQSGHIEAVGFEMYTSMLEHAVNELKGEEQPQRASAHLNLGITLRIDESYIVEENQRLRIYKKIAGAQDDGNLSEVRAELEDRYGELPVSVLHLLDAASLRLLCERTGVSHVDRKRDQMHIRFTSEANIDPGRLMKLVAQNAKKGAQFTPQGVLRFPLKATEPHDVLNEIRSLLEELMATEPAETAAPSKGGSLENMQHKWIALGLLGVACSGCSHKPAQPSAQPSADARLRQLADDYFSHVYFPYAPSNGTQAGFHQYDTQLEDYSRAQVDRETADLTKFEAQFAAIPADQLDLTSQGDLDLLLANIHSQLLSLNTIRLWEKDPDEYSSGISNSAFVLMERTFASPDARLRSLIAREKQMPAVFEAAHQNLKNPPHIYTEIALEQLPDIIHFFQVDVPSAFHDAQDEQLKKEFSETNGAVIAALQSYQTWLKQDVLPRSNGDFRFGADTFSKELLYNEMVDTPLPQLLQIGYADLHKNQAEFNRIAKQVDPQRPPLEVLKELNHDHPAPDQLLKSFHDTFEGLVQFIQAHHIVDIPSPVRPILEETPPFMRATTTASMDTPGPFEKVATQAYFNVTLPGAHDTPTQIDERMQEFNRGTILSTAIHEAYPGHYIQFLWVPQAPSTVRKLLGASSNAEGWAHYCEQMMLDQGYGQPGAGARDDRDAKMIRLGQLQDALLRDARFVVGIEMHTGRMTFDQAVQFFVTEGYQTHASGVVETKRGTTDATYLYYTLGKLQILKLRGDLEKKQGAQFSLARFHDDFLKQGFPPIRIVRRALMNDTSPTL